MDASMTTRDDETGDVPGPAFTGVTLDRADTVRGDPERISRLLHEPATTVVAATADGVLVDDSAHPALLRASVDGDATRFIDPAAAILLGIEDGNALFAADLDGLDPSIRSGLEQRGELISLRDAGALLPQSEGGLAAYLTALLNWHRRHRFCANCGSPTDVVQGGYSRHCPRCGATHFPRTDPCVIMLVEHDGHVLLGRRRGWPESRYSVLAGFVSPGETLEEAVAREVREESGIEAVDARYAASQPWPFPSSLMIGFEARSAGGEPRSRDGELEDVRWFTLEEVLAARAETSELRLPPSVSIARFLIERWVARQRPGG
jgi:NAD+ diphosphatase